jgi:hypothetical protein
MVTQVALSTGYKDAARRERRAAQPGPAAGPSYNLHDISIIIRRFSKPLD